MNVEVFDADPAATGARFSGKQFGESACPALPARTADGHTAAADVHIGVVGEVAGSSRAPRVFRTTARTRGSRPSRSRM